MATDGSNDPSFTLHDQSEEDPEELEERKKREEEMHSLISHAMGQFDFEEFSSRNSSILSNYENKNRQRKDPEILHEQYFDADPKEQLGILHDIRMHEIENVNKELEKLKLDYNKQQETLKRQITLLEIENQQKSLSLKESQNLVVKKTEEILQLNTRLDSLKNSVNDLEFKLKELHDENSVLRQLNSDLEQQKVLLERDFPLKSKTDDREFQESQRIKIDQLEYLLRQANEENSRNNQRYQQLEEELKRNIHNRDNDLLQKNLILNTLTEKNDDLLRKYQKCLTIIDEQTEKLNSTSTKGQHLENEFKKIRENERLEMLSKEIRTTITNEFEKRILSLNSENLKLRTDLQVTEAELVEIRQRLEIMSALKIENQELENKLGKLHDKLNDVNLEKSTIAKKLKQCEEEKNALESQQSRFIAESQLAKILKLENENLQKRVIDLEVHNSKDEHAAQTSFSFVNHSDFINNEEQLVTAQNRILILENQIKQLQEENSQLQVKVNLEQEREFLIRKLQQKAAEFEKIIQKKQRTIETVSTGTNTMNENNSVLKLKHDTLLYQTEAKLHQKLKKEFDDKLTRTLIEFKSLYKCKKCTELQEEYKKVMDLRQEDRNAVLNLVTMWEAKFLQFEKETEEERKKLMNAKLESEQNALHMKQLLTDYKDKYKKTAEIVQNHMGSILVSQKEISVRNYSTLSQHVQKLQDKIRTDNEKMIAIKLSLKSSSKRE